MKKYELGIYKVVKYNETECVNVILENASFEECLKKMHELIGTLIENQYFDICEVGGQSWSYLNDGKGPIDEIPQFDLYEHFGF